jgi:Integrase core domain.
MALHSNSVPDLSDRIIKRPGSMKNSQSLAQYALSWVNYFNDESNVNGIDYSKFRQYCYFVDGISGRYSVIKKYLEMEFDRSHDRVNNIPISLELRNIPTTIASLCNIHGISIANSNINQVIAGESNDQDDYCDTSDVNESSIKKVHFQNKSKNSDSKTSTKQPKQTSVQCWLCDGPHSFRQCNELTRMRSLCIKRPQVLKHFQDLLLKKEGIKVLMDASEFFDGSLTDDENNSCGSKTENSDDKNDSDHHINSLQVMKSNTFTTFDNGTNDIDITQFNSSKFEPYVSNLHEYADQDEAQDFYVLSLEEYSTCFPNEFVDNHNNFDDVFGDGADHVPLYEHISLPASDNPSNDFFIMDSMDLEYSERSHRCEHIHSVSFDIRNIHNEIKYEHFTTQVDGGADRCTTPHRTLVEDMQPPDRSKGEPEYIYDAGKHRHKVEGLGHFRIETWVNGKSSNSLTIPCAYIPSIPSTLVNFRLARGAIMYGEIANLVTKDAIGTLIVGSPDDYTIHKIPLKLRGQRVYASNLLSSRTSNDSDVNKLEENGEKIAIISDEASRLLWHSRLGHLNFRSMASMHLHAKGVPKFKQSHVTDQCGTCLESKLRRSPRGHGSMIDKADVHGQILCADWGFICQKSSDPTRITRLSSVHGDTSYLIFTCAYTGALYGVCAGSKSVPTKWLHTFLHRISYSVGDRPRTVLVDRGSELGRSHQFKEIVELHGYKLITSGPDKSSMNSLGERPHSTIGNALRSILHSAGLDLKYWNFAFYHFIRLFNFFPHGTRNKSPFELIRGTHPDLSLLRIFGCDVYIRPPGRRPSKLDNHFIKGKFLGAIHFDHETNLLFGRFYVEDKSRCPCKV